MDLLFGLVVYTITAFTFGRAFSPAELALVLFFSIGPDLDWLPFLLLKRRLRLVSHWIIHFPLMYIPIGAILIGMISQEWFYVATFVLASVAHFLHDSNSAPGIQWLWPLSRTAHAIHCFRLVRVDPEERRRFYERLRQGASDRSFLDEVLMRIGKGRPEWFRRR